MLLSDADLRVNAVVYLTQHLIVLLNPADIVVNCITPIAGRNSAVGITPRSTRAHPQLPTLRVCWSMAPKECVRSRYCRLREDDGFRYVLPILQVA